MAQRVLRAVGGADRIPHSLAPKAFYDATISRLASSSTCTSPCAAVGSCTAQLVIVCLRATAHDMPSALDALLSFLHLVNIYIFFQIHHHLFQEALLLLFFFLYAFPLWFITGY